RRTRLSGARVPHRRSGARRRRCARYAGGGGRRGRYAGQTVNADARIVGSVTMRPQSNVDTAGTTSAEESMRQPKRSRVLSAALFVMFVSAPAGAQEANPLVRERINVGVAESRGQPVRVQSNVNFFM